MIHHDHTFHEYTPEFYMYIILYTCIATACVCVCACACVRACMRACVCVWVCVCNKYTNNIGVVIISSCIIFVLTNGISHVTGGSIDL